MKASFDIRKITPEALAVLGAPDLAYVRPLKVDGQDVFAIFAANGQQIGLSATRDAAMIAIRQNDMEPQSVH
ncbi:MAG: DUF1150 family protein [Alphaproteobacteria bacterium]|nr:DUF1150 family protein [Alphaproteobacteria bacterium]